MAKLENSINELILELVDNLDIDITNPNHLRAMQKAQKQLIKIFDNNQILAKEKLFDEYGNDLLDENGCVQYVENEDSLYQCCTCENMLEAGSQDTDSCIFCGSGNIVKGCIDEPEPLSAALFDKVNNRKPCAICKTKFIVYECATTADERTLCEDCRISTSKLKGE